MRKNALPVVLTIALLLSGIRCRQTRLPAARCAPPPARAASAAVEEAAAAGGEGLLRCLRELAEWPEATAGSSLRLALILGGFADLAAADPGGSPAAAAELPSFMHALPDSERGLLLYRLSLLRDFCASLSPRQIQGILRDAGREEVPSDAELRRLQAYLEEILEAMERMSIHEQPEKMNIHCGCRCRREKSLL